MNHQLERNGFLEEREIQQIYSIDDQRYLPDRYVTGTCPHCHYERARGDQCENCTKLLSTTELLNPRSTLSSSRNLEVRATKHLFLRLEDAELGEELQTWVDSHETQWTKLTSSIANKWLDEGLQSRCITRDLNWGVSVPNNKLSDKVFYVWFDAPIGYISTAKAWGERTGNDWESWWKQQEEEEAGGAPVHYTQFLAKDNIPFHTILWPATILGSRESWKQVDDIKGFHWLNYYGGKFSTSSKRGVFLDQALDEIEPNPDYWRYALLANAPESDDAAFTWEQFQTRINKDLADKLGNFVNRVLKYTHTKFGPFVPEGGVPGQEEANLQCKCKELVERLRRHLRQKEFRRSTEALVALWTTGNQYLEIRAPWILWKRSDRNGTALVLRSCINLIRLYALASSSIIPHTSHILYDALQLTEEERTCSLAAATDLTILHEGRSFTVPEPLFPKIDDKRVAELKGLYEGDD